jgi:hypothetical protein
MGSKLGLGNCLHNMYALLRQSAAVLKKTATWARFIFIDNPFLMLYWSSTHAGSSAISQDEGG